MRLLMCHCFGWAVKERFIRSSANTVWVNCLTVISWDQQAVEQILLNTTAAPLTGLQESGRTTQGRHRTVARFSLRTGRNLIRAETVCQLIDRSNSRKIITKWQFLIDCLSPFFNQTCETLSSSLFSRVRILSSFCLVKQNICWRFWSADWTQKGFSILNKGSGIF